jgi:hypothetical protein
VVQLPLVLLVLQKFFLLAVVLEVVGAAVEQVVLSTIHQHFLHLERLLLPWAVAVALEFLTLQQPVLVALLLQSVLETHI